MAESVSDQCRSSLNTLQSIVSFFAGPDGQKGAVDEKQVVDELERFSLWIGNIGATHRPQSPLSLESRLREAPDVFEFVSRLLEDLAEVAKERESTLPSAAQRLTIFFSLRHRFWRTCGRSSSCIF